MSLPFATSPLISRLALETTTDKEVWFIGKNPNGFGLAFYTGGELIYTGTFPLQSEIHICQILQFLSPLESDIESVCRSITEQLELVLAKNFS